MGRSARGGLAWLCRQRLENEDSSRSDPPPQVGQRAGMVRVSKLCDEPSFQPTVFYRWQKEFFENGAAAFGQSNAFGQGSRATTDCIRIASLEGKLQRKNEILAELMHEHLALRTGLASR